MLNVTYALDFSVKSLHCIDNCSILKGPYSEGHDQKTRYNGVKIVKKKNYGGSTFFLRGRLGAGSGVARNFFMGEGGPLSKMSYEEGAPKLNYS